LPGDRRGIIGRGIPFAFTARGFHTQEHQDFSVLEAEQAKKTMLRHGSIHGQL
jgi:hypothetical protein